MRISSYYPIFHGPLHIFPVSPRYWPRATQIPLYLVRFLHVYSGTALNGSSVNTFSFDYTLRISTTTKLNFWQNFDFITKFRLSTIHQSKSKAWFILSLYFFLYWFLFLFRSFIQKIIWKCRLYCQLTLLVISTFLKLSTFQFKKKRIGFVFWNSDFLFWYIFHLFACFFSFFKVWYIKMNSPHKAIQISLSSNISRFTSKFSTFCRNIA